MNDIEEGFEEVAEKLEDLVEDLREERDELRVKLHLAKMDTIDEWQELERKWSKLQAKAKRAGHEAADSSGDIAAAAQLLGQEIRAGFRRIAKQL